MTPDDPENAPDSGNEPEFPAGPSDGGPGDLVPEAECPPGRPAPRERVRAELSGLPRWKKLALVVAGLFVLGGLALSLFGDGEPAAPAPSGGASAGAEGGTPPVAGFRAGPGSDGSSTGGTGTTASADAPANPWQPFLVKGGFSFFAGFCIGFALRTFFKVSAAALGLLLLVLFGLAYWEIIQVDWQAIGGYYDGAVDGLMAEMGGFKTFVAGSLPSAGLAGFGFFTGFKRG